MKNQVPVVAAIVAAVAVLGVIGFFVFRMIKGEDTQGVTYGGSPEEYRKRMTQKMGGTGSGYGQNKPKLDLNSPAGRQQQMMQMREQRMNQMRQQNPNAGGGGQ